MNVIIFSVINAIILPLQFAFLKSTEEESVVIEILDKITVTVFVMDIIFNTFTSYIDFQSSEEILDLKSVVKNYILSELFLIDMLSTFPLRSMFFFITNENF